MELRQIRYFLAVAEAKHFTKAAQALGISQSTLSAQVKELERDLGTPLFDRTGRAVRFSEAGKAFLEHAYRTLRDAEAGRDAVKAILAADIGHLRVGVTHCFGTRLMPEIVADFIRRHPGVSLLITNTSGPAIRNGVASGRFDLGISYTMTDAKEVDLEPWLDDELVLVCPTGHPLAGRGSIRFAELHGEPLILTDIDCTSRLRLDEVMEEREISPKIMLEINDTNTILETVRRGAYATIMPRQAVLAIEGIEVIPMIEPNVAMPIAIIWPINIPRTSAMLAFRTSILQVEPLKFPPRS
ncbi:LysR substrate-binding domain-containing protein [Paludisphaera mucosa]|uniref:LysR substrate-binding domain-containing protein n=1 Tax=Paludisphaera mucosa TaxID=3030827 RepID=A0ABT6F9L9_9BACT|nr:LysR substrate-binding domain-containing protein [Paludisphaera mucosa]MDG3004272.1 LysR substrate-binding domain-containing protein [Paludisphaera mucosa]